MDWPESRPPRILRIGSCCPMTPVDSTSESPIPRPANAVDMERAFSIPSVPVTAFAHPLLTTTARALPFCFANTSRDTVTGAAWKALRVKQAAAEASTVERTMPRSYFAGSFLTPQCRP